MFGEIIKKLIHENGFTTAEVARRFNLANHSCARSLLEANDHRLSTLERLLGLINYEIIIRPRGMDRRDDEEIILDKGMFEK